MPGDYEAAELRARILELEEKVEFLYKHLGVTYSTNPDQTDPRIISALKQGNMIEAIKVYREIHNVGLAEAKRAAEEIKRRFML